MKWLNAQGFDVVEHYLVNAENIEKRVEYFAETIKNYDMPSDGLVLVFDDIEYGLSLGRTAKFPRNGIAFKWKDETARTKDGFNFIANGDKVGFCGGTWKTEWRKP